jgi:hypothetical protein
MKSPNFLGWKAGKERMKEKLRRRTWKGGRKNYEGGKGRQRIKEELGIKN